MKTKMFFGNQYVGSFKCDGRKMTKLQSIKAQVIRTTKRTLAIVAILQLAGWIGVGGYYYAKSNVAPVTLWAKQVVEIPVKEVSPVLERIAKCESGGVHTKDGQVIFNANTNKTVDIGKYQINSVWNKKATELGLDLTKESDNEQFALWIYENRGTEDWYSSKSCWSK